MNQYPVLWYIFVHCFSQNLSQPIVEAACYTEEENVQTTLSVFSEI